MRKLGEFIAYFPIWLKFHDVGTRVFATLYYRAQSGARAIGAKEHDTKCLRLKAGTAILRISSRIYIPFV